MRIITFAQAICEGILEEMLRDERIITYGEDIAKQGGIFGTYKCLLEHEEIRERVFDTPISEEVIYGSALGAAIAGLVPIVEFHFADFLFTGITAITNQIMKLRYMTGGQVSLPIVLRGPDGVARSAAAQHSQSIETIFMHVPGIKVVVPSTPYDAKGLIKASIRDPDPVIFFEHKSLYKIKGPVPEEEYVIPLGKADIKREGEDITIIATARMVHEALKAVEILKNDDISVEVVDLRTLVPWDKETVLKSVKKTGGALIVHETWKRAGWGAEIAATINEELFGQLEIPVKRIGARNVPHPFSPPLERFVVPNAEDIVKELKSLF
ncbi:alpha-ketoacid dehydrogenase subunit beta [Thermococcus sp. MV5]|uniref:alpha-ketoacid dehydrogenase subunit beta n=1 Tax=Thermococcus sp. MV5 TaxID=1638272 RepID=UPI00143B7149|nr:alpha-ketoacid dehydrogenase subunit beta [Thermococcus sp. MV5]NJE26580.1 alpha-ketoacid dehydrogenase subunit beta [Thermococcus sp. MV5]